MNRSGKRCEGKVRDRGSSRHTVGGNTPRPGGESIASIGTHCSGRQHVRQAEKANIAGSRDYQTVAFTRRRKRVGNSAWLASSRCLARRFIQSHASDTERNVAVAVV